MRQVVEILKSAGAILDNDHFVGTSGKHFATYINKDALYPHTKETSEICRMLAETVRDIEIDAVVGPALGGIILSTWTAFHLSQIKDKEILGIYTEKNAQGEQSFTRGYDKMVKGKKILVVEDLTTTGNSAKKVIDAATAVGANVVAVAVMLNKNPQEVTEKFFGVPFFALGNMEVPVYDEGACPLCKSGVAINTSVGHGKKFLEKLSL